MSISPGTLVGRYEVRASLGAGGMGEVFLARDPSLGRDVAIKIVRDGERNSDRVRRFAQEAKAASALNHPNVAHVYEVGSFGDVHFIAMELVEGETLRERLRRGPIPLDDVLQIGLQIAAGLAAAHAAQIVHRDIKPENVIIRPDGYVKILDFGLAKLREIGSDDEATVLRTQPGMTVGTLGYMAPEQLSGGEITPATDVFSLGVVLYEMVSGVRPFTGSNVTEIVTAILTKRPDPLGPRRNGIPPKLDLVIGRALARNPEERYAAAELVDELRQISREVMIAGGAASPARRPLSWKLVAAAALVVLLATAGWWMYSKRREGVARELIAAAGQHLAERDYTRAYESAVAAAAILPDHAEVNELLARSSEEVVIESEPPGAAVFLERFDGAERKRVGTTPLTIPRLPHGEYLVTVEMEGYLAARRPLTTNPLMLQGEPLDVQPARLEVRLFRNGEIEPGMVPVEGGEYRLTGWSRPSDRAVDLEDFLIDRNEVSNRDFEEFIRAGGYRRAALWKHPFVESGKPLSFASAMSRFRDTTGLPGPRHWVRGAPPPGLEDHPVTNVTWYEAAAFAEWKGKTLPTIYQWERAARDPADSAIATAFPWGLVTQGDDVTHRVNFQGEGTVPVDSMPFGISPWGAHHMAGNVAEWCRNPKEPGFVVRGGAWSDPVYAFGATGAFPPFYSSPSLGFRCVRESGSGGTDQGGFPLPVSQRIPEFQPVSDEEFAEIRRRYDYEQEPLDARVVERTDEPAWTIERIEYRSAGETVPAYLYLPKGYEPPYQVVQFSPGGDVTRGWRRLDDGIEIWLSATIRSGRAVFAVVREGYQGRPRVRVPPDPLSPQYADYMVTQVTEMRRGLDYLETRPDIDASRTAFFAISAGTAEGVLLAALEDRYRSVMLIGSSLREREKGVTAAANRINFAPRVGGHKFMFHGRYDESAPWETDGRALFDLLPEPKRVELFEGGHIAPSAVLIPTMQKWLDETLGPVDL
ncbi:MAG TPA: protein kinase [Thermoanaerobaculia bacterium]|nr:protein kinase [Thermoanaerobaculia bacterium]